jgi:hypothetical protein
VPADDDVPELIRAISSRVGPRHPAFLREWSNLSAFAAASSPSASGGSQPSTPLAAGGGEMSPPGRAPRSFSELHRSPAALKRSESSADPAVPALADLTAEAVAVLFAVKGFMSKSQAGSAGRGLAVAAETRAAPEDATAAHEEVGRLEAVAQEAEQQCAALACELDRLTGRLKDAEGTVAATEGELTAANARLASADAAAERLQGQVMEAEERLRAADGELRQARERIGELEEQVAEAEERLGAAEGELSEISVKINKRLPRFEICTVYQNGAYILVRANVRWP